MTVAALAGIVTGGSVVAQTGDAQAPVSGAAPAAPTGLDPTSLPARLIGEVGTKKAERYHLVDIKTGADVDAAAFANTAPRSAVMLRRSTFNTDFPNLPRRKENPTTMNVWAFSEVRGAGVSRQSVADAIMTDADQYEKIMPTVQTSVWVGPNVLVTFTPSSEIGAPEKVGAQWSMIRFEDEVQASGKIRWKASNEAGKSYEAIGAGLIRNRINELEKKTDRTPADDKALDKLKGIQQEIAKGADFMTTEGLWKLEEKGSGVVEVTYRAQSLFVPNGGEKMNKLVATMLPNIIDFTMTALALKIKEGQISSYSLKRAPMIFSGQSNAGRAFTDGSYQGPPWYAHP